MQRYFQRAYFLIKEHSMEQIKALKINDVMRETGLGEDAVRSLVKRGKFPQAIDGTESWRESDIALYKLYDEKVCIKCNNIFGKRGRKYKDRIHYSISIEKRDLDKWRKVAKDKGINVTTLVNDVSNDFTASGKAINVCKKTLENREVFVRRVERSDIEKWRKAAKDNDCSLSQYISAVINKYCNAYLKKYAVKD